MGVKTWFKRKIGNECWFKVQRLKRRNLGIKQPLNLEPGPEP